MANDVHLYMLGRDSYILPVGDVTFTIHTGFPPAVASEPPTEPTTTGTASGVVKLTPPEVLILTPPRDLGEALARLDGTVASTRGSQADLAVDLSDTDLEVEDVVEVLRTDGGDGDVTVHLIEERDDG